MLSVSDRYEIRVRVAYGNTAAEARRADSPVLPRGGSTCTPDPLPTKAGRGGEAEGATPRNTLWWDFRGYIATA